MTTIRYLLALVFAIASGVSHAQLILPSDVGVTLTAAPTTQLVPGEPIDFTLAVTNHGSAPVPLLSLTSSHFVDELNFVSANLAECFLVLYGVDTRTGFYYFMSWFVAGLPGTLALNAGETRTFHFQLTLTAQAPPVLPFSFGLPPDDTDPNPSNDRATVVLERAAAPASAIPMLSPVLLTLLAGLLAAIAGFGLRRLSA